MGMLIEHLSESGFSSVEDWIHEYKVLSRAKFDEAYLYKVVLI